MILLSKATMSELDKAVSSSVQSTNRSQQLWQEKISIIDTYNLAIVKFDLVVC